MTEKEALEAQLKGFSNLNGGVGPVVPKWMAERLRQLGITAGYVEQKDLPS